MTTSGDIVFNTTSDNVVIQSNDLNISTTCSAGYDLTLSTSVSDNNLYLNGDSSTTNTYFTPSNGTSTLSQSPHTWGYSLGIPSENSLGGSGPGSVSALGPSVLAPTKDNIFLPVPASTSESAVLKSSDDTASDSEIEDSFSVYYGVNLSRDIVPGSYSMINDTTTNSPGTISYYLTANPSCATFLNISFNQNLDGEGGETSENPDDIVSNFPDSSENVIDAINSTLTLSSKHPTRPGYIFKEWNTEADGDGDSYEVGDTITIGSNTEAGELGGNVAFYAIWQKTVTINYDGNGLYYNNDSTDTINQVTYTNTTTTTTKTITRYSHTSNVNDAGVASGNYANSLSTTDTVTIDGASSLNVTIYYDAESTTYDWVSVYQSPFTISNTNDATVSATTGNLSGKLSGRKSGRTTNYSTWYTQTYTVTGDTVKFHFRSDSSDTYYGYYAIVTAEVEVESEILSSTSGTYVVPSSSQTHVFLGWSENQNATTPTFTSEQDIINNPDYIHSISPITLYAIYSMLETITVNLDSNTTSVTFMNPSYPAQTVTTDGGTVELYSNTSYTITSSFASGYTIDTWSTTTGGTIGNPIVSSTTYIITAPTTLSITSKAPGSITSFTPATCATLSPGDIIELTDTRDGSVYKISKLADNNCWMLDNLRLDLTDSNVQSNLTSSTTNASNATLDYLKNGGGTTSDRYPTSAVQSSMASSYSVPRINTSYKDTDASVTYGNGSGKIGVYYNYCAASAGSYCYGNGTSNTGSPSTDPNSTSLIDTPEDTCPAGWRMPTSSSSGEYQALYAAYSSNVDNFRNALSTLLSGYFNGGSISSQGTYSDFWSSTWYNGSYMYRLYTTSSAISPSSYGYRYQGYPVRCILGSPSFNSVTVTLDPNTSSVTFTNPTYGTITATQSDNTVELRKGVEYTITANIVSAVYELSSWSTSSNGTIGDLNENPTTFTIAGDATLSALSDIEKPGYEVTVTFDENVRSVALYQETLGTQQVTTSGGTVSLRRGVEYILTASYADGQATNTWTTTENGTLGSTTSPATTYSVVGTATLSLSSQPKSGSATLLPGQNLNATMKTLAEGKSTQYDASSSKIKALKMASSLSVDFIASSSNTVSTSNSEKPVYIFFDNTNDAGIMYFYTEARDIYMNPDSSSAFRDNTALTDIDALSAWNTGSVTNMSYIFYGATALTDIDALSIWNTGSVTDMSYMFCQAYALTDIDALSNWNTSSVTNMSYMFRYVHGLANIDGASTWNTSSVTNMSYMFEGASALTNIDALSDWNTGSVTNMSYMFSATSALTNIDGASTWNTSSVINMSYMFYCAFALTNIDGASNWNTSSVTNMSHIFRIAQALTNIDGASNWNTSSVTNMSYMFHGTSALTNIDGASNWNTGSVTNMSYMFQSAHALTNIDALSNWNTSSVTNMSYMFSNASALTNINALSTWNTSSVTDMSYMFQSTYALTNTDGVNNWDISKVSSFSNMFNSASSKPSFNKRLGTWNTSGTFTPVSTSAVVTVDLDSHVKSISLYNVTYGTRTVSNGETVSIAKNTEYTISANYDTGYTVDTWSSTTGTIGSATSPSTTYQISSDATLSITSTTASTSTVTVSIDSNVSSVNFSHPYYDTQTINSNNGTATLVNNLDYNIIIEYADGYKEDSITTSSNGIIGATTINGITYTITGNDTLAITSTTKSGSATLLTGQSLNATMKTLAEGKSTSYYTSSSKIKSLKMASFLPSDFTSSTSNTVSTSNSEKPVYIFFDNTNNAGIMYFYTEARDIYMNPDSSSAFYYNAALTNIDGASTWNTSSVTNMGSMFSRAFALTNIDGASTWNTSSVTNMSSMFSDTYTLTNIDGTSNWNTGNVTNMSYMFSHAYALTNINALSTWNTSSVTNMSYMFRSTYALTNVNALSTWNTSSVTNMSYMFQSTYALTNINALSTWNTGSVTNMSYMFDGAIALTNIDGASNWNTSSVTNMSHIFDNTALTNIDALSAWNTSSVTNMSYMFQSTYALTNINALSTWNTGSVTDMSYMFSHAYALTDIDALANWNTSSVTNMSYMFDQAFALTDIDGASNWNTSRVTNMSYMFSKTYALTDASAINNWDIRAVQATSGSSSSSSNYFYYMFNSSYPNSHPNFTMRSGTWNSDGTFIPD